MITHLIQEMQDVTPVAGSLQAWKDISRSAVHTHHAESSRKEKFGFIQNCDTGCCRGI